MEPTKKFGPFSSSIDPEKLGTTIQAVARVVSGMLLFSGVISVEDNTTIMTQVPQAVAAAAAIVPLAYSVWHASEVVFGILRKAVVAVGKMLAKKEATV